VHQFYSKLATQLCCWKQSSRRF